MDTQQGEQPQDTTFFLPDFCDVRAVLMVVIICELLAFMLTLAPLKPAHDRWNNLGQISLFIQWLGLSSAAVLCLSKRFLKRLATVPAITLTYLTLLGNSLLFSELAFQIASRLSIAADLSEVDHISFLLRNTVIAAIIFAVVLRYFYIQGLWKHHVETQSQLKLAALQARIHPHFLFNTMNTIASLTRENPVLAETAIEDLSDLLRISLSRSQHEITLQEEITLCHRYLEIEKLRLGDRLQVEWALGDIPMDAKVPPLLIQPLLENAIYHGIEPLSRIGRITVSAQHKDGMISIEVDNPLPDCDDSGHKGHQIALDNTRQRLNAAFGEAASMAITSGNGRYQASLHFPCTL